MTDYRRQLHAVAEALEFRSALSYSWFGEAACPYTISQLTRLPPALARSYVLDSLRSHLYSHFYCSGQARPMEEKEKWAGAGRAFPDLLEHLSEANCGQGYWEGGWRVIASREDMLRVSKGGLSLWVKPGEYLPLPESSGDTPVTVSVRMPTEQLRLSPGFYMALGDAPLTGEGEGGNAPLLRVYWHIGSEGAVRLVASLTRLLNTGGQAFRLKVLTAPGTINRCDRAVLYVRRDAWQSLSASLAQVYVECAPYMEKNVPALSRAIAPGLGVAEDPGSSYSFGLHRCGLIADALLASYEASVCDPQAKVEMIASRFAEVGLDIERPYLAPGSQDQYDPVLVVVASHLGQCATTPENKVSMVTQADAPFNRPGILKPDELLEAASRIGSQIVERAMWHGGACNWVAPDIQAAIALSRRGLRTGAALSALGPDLYKGTSGVALFLGELGAVTGDSSFRLTARAGIEQALSHAELIPPRERTGLYTGWFGIIRAAIRLGELLEDTGLKDRGRQMAQRLLHSTDAFGYDLLSGSAGSVLGWVRLAEALQEPRFLDVAATWVTRLIAGGRHSKRGLSWPGPMGRRRHELTGFSHGTAGIAYALLELYAVTGEESYRQAVEAALDYENSWLDMSVQNWPDLRSRTDPIKYPGARTFTTYWCHGAPGIAISRLRAFEVLDAHRYLADARLALRTTGSAVQAAMSAAGGNFCLCHGLSGNTEVLLYGAKALQAAGEPSLHSDARLYYDTACRVAQFGLEWYARGRHTWPCGDSDGSAELPAQHDGSHASGSSDFQPGLMTGLAGIGLFYLRRYDDSISSVIAP